MLGFVTLMVRTGIEQEMARRCVAARRDARATSHYSCACAERSTTDVLNPLEDFRMPGRTTCPQWLQSSSDRTRGPPKSPNRPTSNPMPHTQQAMAEAASERSRAQPTGHRAVNHFQEANAMAVYRRCSRPVLGCDGSRGRKDIRSIIMERLGAPS